MSNTNVLAGMRCPNCGSDGPFFMDVAVFGRALVSDDGLDYSDMANTETEFRDDGDVECHACQFRALIAHFES